MSMSLFLVPLVVALSVTAAETVDSLTQKCADPSFIENNDNQIQTRFNDTALLQKTLCEHGVKVTKFSSLKLVAECAEGVLIYERNTEDEPFVVTISKVSDVNRLVEDFKELEEEYDLNVQTFTYNRVVENLPEHMSIESEQIMEDDSILLTINVDE